MNANILCIDDIKTNIFTIESVIECCTESKYNFFSALSAHDGLSILLKEKIDLILLDIMMPEIDGLAAAKMIKSNKRTKDIPIIFVTAKKDDATIDMCYEVGGVDYISKPINATELLNRISFHLRLRDKQKLLKKEKEYAQNLIDLQDNFVIVTDSVQITRLNNTVLDFFGLTSLFEFQKKFGCICSAFEKDEAFFSLLAVKEDELWADVVIDKVKKNEDVVVKIKNCEEQEYIFTLKAAKFYDLYIVTLTDITTISEQSKEFEHGANFDSLTQIYNREAFSRFVDAKIDNYKYHRNNFVLAILDIDHFKKVNDTYGHLAGDEVLKKLAYLVKTHIRKNDVFARYGGEEFVLLLDVDMEKSKYVIEHLRASIEKERFDDVGNITCSFGLTEYKKNDNIKSMLKRADEALYRAKESGRNRVCQEN